VADYLYLIIALAVVLVGALAGLVTSRVRGRSRTAPPPPAPSEPQVGDDAETPSLPDGLLAGARRELASGGGQGGPLLPVAVHRVRDLDGGPTLREALGVRPDEIWVLRPDGHVAAVLTHAAEVAPAVARLLTRPVPTPVPA
jgi:hypothetical protein